MSTNTPQLTKLQQKILLHVLAFRVTTISCVATRLEARPNAVSKLLARMVKSGLLQKYSLTHRHDYYTFGPVAVAHYGVSARWSDCLTSQTLPDYLATNWLLTAFNPPANRLMRQEITERYPWLDVANASTDGAREAIRSLHSRPMFEQTEGDQTQLCVLLIDRSKLGACLCRKAERITGGFSQYLPELASAINSNTFKLVFVVATSTKAASLERKLAQTLPDTVLADIEELPELTPLLLRSHQAEEPSHG